MIPSVTVLLAVHNGGEYLHGVVEDVLAQTYDDFELLVVDDASTDGSPDLVLAAADERIRLLRNDRNIGQVPSLNLGLREARGAYVARIDHDDRMLPTRLERQVEVLDREPEAALVGTWIDVVDEEDGLWAKPRGDVRDYVDFVLAILRDRYPFGHPSLMYRREVVLTLGGYEPALAPAEDKDLYRRLALARYEARVVREALVRYRRHAAQLSQERHELQLAVDHAGQERFLAELVGTEAAPALRALLADGTAGAGAAALLDRLVEGAAGRLRLSTAEREKLERGLAGHVTRRAARRGTAARYVLAWSIRRRARYALLLPVLPLVPAVRAAARPVYAAARRGRLSPLGRRARRVRWLRWIYARVRAASVDRRGDVHRGEHRAPPR